MNLLSALVLALMGALATGWIVWLRREQERDTAELMDRIQALSQDINSLRSALDSVQLQVMALRGTTDAARAELTDFVHGPPSQRRPTIHG
ncbi:MAG: hypothetical protein IPK82_03360 [Polyangiaceae bacterium]|nr:hypothetical protein [Polyangiaceae bacterium]